MARSLRQLLLLESGRWATGGMVPYCRRSIEGGTDHSGLMLAMRPPAVFGFAMLAIAGVFVAAFAADLGGPTDSGGDRAGFPRDFARQFQILRTRFKPQKNQVATACASAAAVRDHVFRRRFPPIAAP